MNNTTKTKLNLKHQLQSFIWSFKLSCTNQQLLHTHSQLVADKSSVACGRRIRTGPLQEDFIRQEMSSRFRLQTVAATSRTGDKSVAYGRSRLGTETRFKLTRSSILRFLRNSAQRSQDILLARDDKCGVWAQDQNWATWRGFVLASFGGEWEGGLNLKTIQRISSCLSNAAPNRRTVLLNKFPKYIRLYSSPFSIRPPSLVRTRAAWL